MKYFIISIFTISVLLQACGSTSNGIEPDEVAKRIFTPTELAGIGQMIHYVDSIVSERTQIADVNESYHAYFDLLANCISNEEVFPQFVEDSLKFIFLDTLDDEAFSAIWRKGVSYVKAVRYKDTVYTDFPPMQCLGLNILDDNNEEGKFLRYMKEIGNSDEKYATFSDDYKRAGDFSPTIVVSLLFKNQYDFTIYKDRMMAMVFLLMMQDPIEKMVERYFNVPPC